MTMLFLLFDRTGAQGIKRNSIGFKSFFTILGPGIAIAATGVGAGDTVASNCERSQLRAGDIVGGRCRSHLEIRLHRRTGEVPVIHRDDNPGRLGQKIGASGSNTTFWTTLCSGPL